MTATGTGLRPFLRVLFDGAMGVMEFRALPSKRTAFIPWHDYKDVERFIAQCGTDNLYVGVATRKDATSGKLENCSTLGALFTDIDFKATPEADAREALAAFPLPPTLIVHSGGGLHVYYALRGPLDLQTDADRARGLLERLAVAFRGDRSAAEPARILRLPGTLNRKPEYGTPRPVTLELCDPGRRYNPGELEEWLPALSSGGNGSGRFHAPEEPIGPGARRPYLFRLARSLKARGLTEAAVRAAAREENTARCRPPVPDDEVARQVRSAFEQADRPGFEPGANGTGPSAGPVAVAVRLSAVSPQRIAWVWPSRLARGKLTVISGDPGLGKSLLTLDVAARISRATRWPDRGEAPLGSVVLLSAEDGVADTILPRFLAMGGDPSKVHVLQAVRTGDRERPFDLTTDLAALEALVARIGDLILIGVDPIGAYLGRTDSHRDASMRGVLLPLAAMAERVGTAVVAIAHLNKATKETARKALYRTTGSIALPAAARMAFVVGEHPDDPERRVLVHQKNNLAPVPPTLGFQIVATGDQVARVEWDAAPVAGLTADDVLTAESPDPATPAVIAFLAQLVADGPVPAVEGRRQAEAEGFSETTVRRARQRLGIVARKLDMASGWWWVATRTTPEDATPPPEDARRRQSPGSGVFGVFEDATPPEDATPKPENGVFVASSKESSTYETLPPEGATQRGASRARARLVEVPPPGQSFLRQMPTAPEVPETDPDEEEL